MIPGVMGGTGELRVARNGRVPLSAPPAAPLSAPSSAVGRALPFAVRHHCWVPGAHRFAVRRRLALRAPCLLRCALLHFLVCPPSSFSPPASPATRSRLPRSLNLPRFPSSHRPHRTGRERRSGTAEHTWPAPARGGCGTCGARARRGVARHSTPIDVRRAAGLPPRTAAAGRTRSRAPLPSPSRCSSAPLRHFARGVRRCGACVRAAAGYMLRAGSRWTRVVLSLRAHRFVLR